MKTNDLSAFSIYELPKPSVRCIQGGTATIEIATEKIEVVL